jgi:hypothetical protein
VVLPSSLRILVFPYEISNQWIETSDTTKSLVEQINVPFIHMDSLSPFLEKFPCLERLTAALGSINNYNNLQMDTMSQSPVIFHTLRYLNIDITQTVSVYVIETLKILISSIYFL